MLPAAYDQLAVGHGQPRVDRLAQVVLGLDLEFGTGGKDKRLSLQITDVEPAFRQKERAPELAAQPFLPDDLAGLGFEALGEAVGVGQVEMVVVDDAGPDPLRVLAGDAPD